MLYTRCNIYNLFSTLCQTRGENLELWLHIRADGEKHTKNQENKMMNDIFDNTILCNKCGKKNAKGTGCEKWFCSSFDGLPKC